MFPCLDFEFLSFCFHSNVTGGVTSVIRGMMQAHSWPVRFFFKLFYTRKYGFLV